MPIASRLLIKTICKGASFFISDASEQYKWLQRWKYPFSAFTPNVPDCVLIDLNVALYVWTRIHLHCHSWLHHCMFFNSPYFNSFLTFLKLLIFPLDNSSLYALYAHMDAIERAPWLSPTLEATKRPSIHVRLYILMGTTQYRTGFLADHQGF